MSVDRDVYHLEPYNNPVIYSPDVFPEGTVGRSVYLDDLTGRARAVNTMITPWSEILRKNGRLQEALGSISFGGLLLQNAEDLARIFGRRNVEYQGVLRGMLQFFDSQLIGPEGNLIRRCVLESTIKPIPAVYEPKRRRVLAKVLESLWYRDALVLDDRFGLTSGLPKTLKEVGDKLGTSRERIRLIEERALKRMNYPSRSRKFLLFAPFPKDSIGERIFGEDYQFELLEPNKANLIYFGNTKSLNLSDEARTKLSITDDEFSEISLVRLIRSQRSIDPSLLAELNEKIRNLLLSSPFIIDPEHPEHIDPFDV